MSVKLNGRLEIMDSNLWGNIIRIEKQVAKQFIKGKDRRIICEFNGKEKNHCAIMPSPEGYFIMLNKDLRKKLQIQAGDMVHLTIEKDNSKYGMPLSEEFELIILGDEEVAHHFEKLTAGKQRNLIHLVNKVKSSEIKINRAMAIAHHLLIEEGNIDFRKLNEVIKEFNQKNKIL